MSDQVTHLHVQGASHLSPDRHKYKMSPMILESAGPECFRGCRQLAGNNSPWRALLPENVSASCRDKQASSLCSPTFTQVFRVVHLHEADWPDERMFDVRCLMFDLARDAHLKFAFML